MNNQFRTIHKLASVLKIIDITDFFHLRINRKNQFFILSNNKVIVNYLNEDRNIGILLKKVARSAVCKKIYVAVWKEYADDDFLGKIYKLGIWNGISIALPFNDYIDIFSFASSVKNTELTNFYLNYFRLLKRFIIFFRLKGKKVIEHANQNLCDLSENIELYCQSDKEEIAIINSIRRQIFPRNVFINTVYLKKITLTKKETSYLIMLLEGKSMVAIANELRVSTRSVESCFEIIKSKTGFRTKAELLNAFLESQIYQPSIYYGRHNRYR